MKLFIAIGIIYKFVITRWIILPLLLTAWQGDTLSHTDAEWKDLLGEKRYNVMRKKGTEPPFLGEYVFTEIEGAYHCAACDLPLFHSKNKYRSGSGWPSFTQPISPKNVYYKEDWSSGFKMYEILCSRCNSHLGHIFNDNPDRGAPPQLRYCINSISLTLK